MHGNAANGIAEQLNRIGGVRRKNRDAQADAEQIIRHLDRYGVVDKDAMRPVKKKQPAGTAKNSKLPGKTLDLHGLTEAEAVPRIRNEVLRCKENGIARLLIVHGRGYHSSPGEGPVLQKLVRTMLEHELQPVIRDWISALPKEGGEGATVVRLF
ncbi:MAG: hypothetical protein GF350_10845 [Chitinivibrionales bacterium]|nr:hypothetical protein [Chitinivibrionales bacterium]